MQSYQYAKYNWHFQDNPIRIWYFCRFLDDSMKRTGEKKSWTSKCNHMMYQHVSSIVTASKCLPVNGITVFWWRDCWLRHQDGLQGITCSALVTENVAKVITRWNCSCSKARAQHIQRRNSAPLGEFTGSTFHTPESNITDTFTVNLVSQIHRNCDC